MEILLGLLIIAIGSFGQSSSYVPIKKVKSWAWESFWIVQGIFAWLVFPFLGALLGVPQGMGLFELLGSGGALKSIVYGVLWGVGGLTFGLSMRYLGVALGQSISLGTCAGFGTLLPAIFAGTNLFRGEGLILLVGVCITLAGIAVIVTFGGFLTNAAYCIQQNVKNHTGGDYFSVSGSVLVNNLLFCALAGVLWYSQFFGLEMGKSFLADSPLLLAFSWSILMSLNVTFSNVWGILLKEWKGCDRKTITVLVVGLVILVFSVFAPSLMNMAFGY